MTHLTHTFLSYCRDDKDLVRTLREELIQNGIKVWWDDDILPGQDWKYEIRMAMASAHSVVLCFSRNLTGRERSAVYPELLEAIAEQRHRRPGEIFVIPVRLCDCELPDVEIDTNRTLANLQRVDLFPDSERRKQMQKLLEALKRKAGTDDVSQTFNTSGARSRVTITINIEHDAFDRRAENTLRHALAHFLDVPVDQISIIAVKKGSTKVVVELPEYAAQNLLRNATALPAIVKGLQILQVDEYKDMETPFMNQGPPRVFISHIHEDADFAKAIATWLETTLLSGVRCFISSDRGIPLGSQWLGAVESALGESAVMLVLVSRTSMLRRWIYFEAGAGFVRGIPVVPICIAGMKGNELEPPLNFLQAIELPNSESEYRLLKLVAEPAHLMPPPTAPRIDIPERITPVPVGIRDEERPRRVFANADDNAFNEFFQLLARNANQIVLVGTGLNILYRSGTLGLLEPGNKHRWEIYVANPYSPEVEARLIEEETGSPKPPVGKAGLIKRLEMLLDFERKRGDGTLVVRLFSHYPTISFFIIDNRHYFFYPYGFSTLGDFSPVVCCSADNPEDTALVRFLDEQYKRTKNSSVDAALVHALRSGATFDVETRRSIQGKLTPFAVYIVPQDGTELYDFGSACLGFDLRRQVAVQSRWPPRYVRNTAEFGFHLTVADALYFAEHWSVQMLQRELRVLAGEFWRFPLQFELTPGFPDASSVSLVCRDDTGTLEALHHELVFRCYRRAIASNYSSFFGNDQAKMNRVYGSSHSRGELMIERYHAPYILNEFKPHLSLLSNVEPADMMTVLKALEQSLPRSPFIVSSLCLLTKPTDGAHWKIIDESGLR